MVQSKDFNFLNLAYQNGWCNFEKLKLFVQRRGITAEEFRLITGQDYSAQ